MEEAIALSMASLQEDEQRRQQQAADAAPAPATAPQAPAAPQPLSYAELAAATSDFAPRSLVGVGGFGSVYRAAALASLPQCGACAVKRLITGGGDPGGRGGRGGRGARGGRGVGDGAMAEVLKEVELLGRCAPHANLLPLLGYCHEAAHPPCLVYPLCAGGTLEDRLMPHTSAAKGRLAALGWAEAPAPLSWRARLAILRDAARALSHLHAQSLLHGDVKPSNILLGGGGGGGGARLADFGLSRMAKTQEAPSGATQASVSAVKGTAAFLDPIYVQDGLATELTDGFALGVTMLVTLTGLPATGLKQKWSVMPLLEP